MAKVIHLQDETYWELMNLRINYKQKSVNA